MSCNAESKTFFWVFQKWFKTFLGGSTNLQPYILSTYLQNDAPSLFQKNILLCLNSLKFIYSEKATKFCEISTLLLSNVVPVKSKVAISQNFVAFSEYMNINKIFHRGMNGRTETVVELLWLRKNASNT